MTEASRWRIPKACIVFISVLVNCTDRFLAAPLGYNSPHSHMYWKYAHSSIISTSQIRRSNMQNNLRQLFLFHPTRRDLFPSPRGSISPRPDSEFDTAERTRDALVLVRSADCFSPKKIRSDPRCRCVLNLAARRQLGRRPKQASSVHGAS